MRRHGRTVSAGNCRTCERGAPENGPHCSATKKTKKKRGKKAAVRYTQLRNAKLGTSNRRQATVHMKPASSQSAASESAAKSKPPRQTHRSRECAVIWPITAPVEQTRERHDFAGCRIGICRSSGLVRRSATGVGRRVAVRNDSSDSRDWQRSTIIFAAGVL
jgi:hypothetical protein